MSSASSVDVFSSISSSSLSSESVSSTSANLSSVSNAPPNTNLSGGYNNAVSYTDTNGYQYFKNNVQLALANNCGSCHLGQRFSFASLERAGGSFTDAETQENYRTFVDLLSLDNPSTSRLLAKILPSNNPKSMPHRGGSLVSGTEDALYQTLLYWANAERDEKCPNCGLNAPKAYIAYIEQPDFFWMIEREPVRTDRGLRTGARIMLQQVNPATSATIGTPVDFLANSNFCSGANNDCDFGNISANHQGTMLTFECRLPVSGESYLERSWNICIAGIGANGQAVNPRFLLPANQRQAGLVVSRLDPFGTQAGLAQHTYWDPHFAIRNASDLTPAFTPNDEEIIFASQRPDPFSGVQSVQTYHGEFIIENLITVDLDGYNMKTIYRNDGGEAKLPFYLRSGKVAFRTWNLERMDRFMYVQGLPDGMIEMPALGGRVQGENMWGKAFETTNGAILGLTGSRRGEINEFSPFLFDHPMGISELDKSGTIVDNTGSGFINLLGQNYLDEIGPFGFCNASNPAAAANALHCSLSKLVLDPSFLPTGKALIAYNPEKTYVNEGESFVQHFVVDPSNVSAARVYFPKNLGIGTIDKRGNLATLIQNPAGKMLRYPVWVGSKQHPRIYEPVANPETASDFHIADFPIWLSFQEPGNERANKINEMNILNTIKTVRVLRKVGDSNACITDHKYISMSNAFTNGDHPSALGLHDPTGYERIRVSTSAGGNAFGDTPLEIDKSVKLKLPRGELLLFQGVNAAGEVVSQHSRVFATPGGHEVNAASVKKEQYNSQCAACHGVIDNSMNMKDIAKTENLPAVLSFDTEANSLPAVDLTANVLAPQELTYLASIRPILDQKCVVCHTAKQENSLGGGLSLDSTYSATANYPVMNSIFDEKIALQSDYIEFMKNRNKVRGADFSVSYAWAFKNDESYYDSAYKAKMNADSPLGDLAPWDPGYQSLFRQYLDPKYSNPSADDSRRTFYYLSSAYREVFGRAFGIPSNSAHSFLLEVLTGRDTDKSKNYTGSYNHTSLLSNNEIATFQAVLDVGFPYMARCDSKIITSGVNAGKPWGEPGYPKY